ncbi:hypothetical protein ANN_17544 [Periplaneta americana]|uniref:Uncharacterized protein n=1 Tax=Periplaneta americana TaxID=6978 RepID=A0ABQ8SVC6_PERAM|nr:hypothetical protein ANN_17544 [Periplaneta americana]
MTKAQEICMKAAELNFWRKCIRKTVMDRVKTEDIRMAVSRNTTIILPGMDTSREWKFIGYPGKFFNGSPGKEKKRTSWQNLDGWNEIGNDIQRSN